MSDPIVGLCPIVVVSIVDLYPIVCVVSYSMSCFLVCMYVRIDACYCRGCLFCCQLLSILLNVSVECCMRSLILVLVSKRVRPC